MIRKFTRNWQIFTQAPACAACDKYQLCKKLHYFKLQTSLTMACLNFLFEFTHPPTSIRLQPNVSPQRQEREEITCQQNMWHGIRCRNMPSQMLRKKRLKFEFVIWAKAVYYLTSSRSWMMRYGRRGVDRKDREDREDMGQSGDRGDRETRDTGGTLGWLDQQFNTLSHWDQVKNV